MDDTDRLARQIGSGNGQSLNQPADEFAAWTAHAIEYERVLPGLGGTLVDHVSRWGVPIEKLTEEAPLFLAEMLDLPFPHEPTTHGGPAISFHLALFSFLIQRLRTLDFGIRDWFSLWEKDAGVGIRRASGAGAYLCIEREEGGETLLYRLSDLLRWWGAAWSRIDSEGKPVGDADGVLRFAEAFNADETLRTATNPFWGRPWRAQRWLDTLPEAIRRLAADPEAVVVLDIPGMGAQFLLNPARATRGTGG